MARTQTKRRARYPDQAGGEMGQAVQGPESCSWTFVLGAMGNHRRVFRKGMCCSCFFFFKDTSGFWLKNRPYKAYKAQ